MCVSSHASVLDVCSVFTVCLNRCVCVLDRAVCAQRMLAWRSYPGGDAGQRNLRSGGSRPQQALSHHAGSL